MTTKIWTQVTIQFWLNNTTVKSVGNNSATSSRYDILCEGQQCVRYMHWPNAGSMDIFTGEPKLSKTQAPPKVSSVLLTSHVSFFADAAMIWSSGNGIRICTRVCVCVFVCVGSQKDLVCVSWGADIPQNKLVTLVILRYIVKHLKHSNTQCR